MINKEFESLSPIPDPSDTRAMKRQIAEARMRMQTTRLNEDAASLSPEAIRQMLHELGVHQIELEMQNQELREAQVALDAARDRYFDLYDLAPVGYFAVSEHGTVRQANLTAARMLGLVRSALQNKTLSRFILNEDQDIYYLHRKNLLESELAQSFDLRMLKSDQSTFWAHLTMSTGLDADGQLELRVVVDDINDRWLLQQDLLAKNKALEHAIVVADNANQAKSDFLSSMSHELRTPLHAILGFGQLLSTSAGETSAQSAAEQQRSVDQILKAGWHLLELINEILDLAVIEAGQIHLSMEPVSLPELVSQCQTMIGPMAQEHGISLQVEPASAAQVVLADVVRVKQVIINLLSNAIKYNRPDGSVTVSCVTLPTGRIRLGVADTGLGLNAEQLAQLFVPFNRLGQEFLPVEGTGIGLVVCKRLTELMGGKIWAESVPDQGSVFSIELNQYPTTSSLSPG